MPRTAAFTSFTSTGDFTDNIDDYNFFGAFSKGWHFYTKGWKSGETFFCEVLGLRDTYSGRSGQALLRLLLRVSAIGCLALILKNMVVCLILVLDLWHHRIGISVHMVIHYFLL